MKRLLATTTVAQLSARLHQQADEVATLPLVLDMQRNRIALTLPDFVWPNILKRFLTFASRCPRVGCALASPRFEGGARRP